MITIKEVKTKKDLKTFAKFPVDLYKDCPYYVPALQSDELNTFNPKKNHSLVDCKIKGYLAYKDGVLVGRIAGVIHKKSNEIHNQKYIRFSRFEAIDDLEVFSALLNKIKEYGKENGMEYMHGPWGFNDTDREGMLTYGFDTRATYSTNYYYPYFYKNMEKLGFKDESKWLEKMFTVPSVPYERLTKMNELVKKRLKVKDVADEMSVRKILKNYKKQFFDTLNEAYGHLDGYVPIVGKAQDNVLKQFATIVNRRYISILVDDKEQVAAFAIVLPSIADALIKSRGKLFPFHFINVLRSIKRPKELEMALIAVKPEYKNTGINAILMNKIMLNVMADGIKEVASNPMLESNYNIQQNWKFAENRLIRKRQTYVISLDEDIK